jgi:uncharacterized membrane protein (UPF0127 family)
MKSDRSKGKSRSVSRKKKKKNKNIVLVAVAILVLLAFIILMTVPPSFFNRSPSTITEEEAPSVTIPQFRHDGILYFITNAGKDTVPVDIEVVDSQQEISRGLMYRPSMPESAGMLFIFPDEVPRSFWMKNTYISLDIIYISSDKEIVTIQPNTQPLSTQSVPSHQPAKYVVEVNAGFTARHKIREGDKIDF